MADPVISDGAKSRVMECLDRNWISNGPVVREFEDKLAEYCGADYCIAMNNGTSTLHALLLALGVGPGDEVIVPDITYISTLSVILHVGARPVIVRSDKDTFNINSEDVLAGISSATKAVLTVDMKGMPVDFDSISDVCDASNIFFLSDSAESLGAVYKNDRVGTQASAHSFSFFANKNLFTGEGGCITTNSEWLAEELRCIRNQGQTTRYIHPKLGHNFRFNDVLASIGIDQVSKLDQTLASKEKICRKYSKYFQSFSGESHVSAPILPGYVTQHSWYNYCIKFESSEHCERVKALFDERDIEWRVSFPPLTSQPLLKNYDSRVLVNPEESSKLYSCMLDIPCHPGLTDDDVNEIIELCLAP
ncbi:DegT/DnrJ/EryC1/StrS family aminotransferase [Litoricolaceae bacterium]|nr:DegT/DnrJ/EryC1/StrS family aminotransferase [Litorivicinaceae bacterium]